MLIRDLTGGTIVPSIGMIRKLKGEYSKKTQTERERVFLEIVASRTLYAGAIFSRLDGKQTTVIICAEGK